MATRLARFAHLTAWGMAAVSVGCVFGFVALLGYWAVLDDRSVVVVHDGPEIQGGPNQCFARGEEFYVTWDLELTRNVIGTRDRRVTCTKDGQRVVVWQVRQDTTIDEGRQIVSLPVRVPTNAIPGICRYEVVPSFQINPLLGFVRQKLPPLDFCVKSGSPAGPPTEEGEILVPPEPAGTP